jgi:hypothetical protein
MSFVVDDLRQAAGQAAMAMMRSGYRANFRPESLWEVDRLFDQAGSDVPLALGDPHGTGHSLFAGRLRR